VEWELEVRRVQNRKRRIGKKLPAYRFCRKLFVSKIEKKRSITVARTRLSDASFCIEGLGIYLQNGN